jgi:hypothetical protein
MPGLDPSIVEHRIETWPDITPVRQKQRPLHPSKAAAIKAEIDKLRTAGFYLPHRLHVMGFQPCTRQQKQGTIRVCTDFRDLNNACPKENFPTPFIDQVIDDCAGHEALSFMTDSLAITKFRYTQPISIKLHSLPRGVLSHIVSCLLA